MTKVSDLRPGRRAPTVDDAKKVQKLEDHLKALRHEMKFFSREVLLKEIADTEAAIVELGFAFSKDK